jgi:hypothetical protein
MTAPRLLTLEEIASVKKYHGREHRTFQIDKKHNLWISLNDILETARAALLVVEAAKENMRAFKRGHDGCEYDECELKPLFDALLPFRESENLDCPSCDNPGSYASGGSGLDGGDFEQIQCEWCHVTPNSKFNSEKGGAND